VQQEGRRRGHRGQEQEQQGQELQGAGAHPIAANAKIAVAQLDGLLLADDGLCLMPVVHQNEVVAQALVLGKLDGRGAAHGTPPRGACRLLHGTPLLLELLQRGYCSRCGG
jgi:hypothetical protein